MKGYIMIRKTNNILIIPSLALMLVSLTACSAEPIVGTWIKVTDTDMTAIAPEEITISSTIFGKLYYDYNGTKVKYSSREETVNTTTYYFRYSKRYDMSFNSRYKGASMTVEYNNEINVFTMKSYSVSNWYSEYDTSNISLREDVRHEKK